jgi:hypothetical protein
MIFEPVCTVCVFPYSSFIIALKTTKLVMYTLLEFRNVAIVAIVVIKSKKLKKFIIRSNSLHSMSTGCAVLFGGNIYVFQFFPARWYHCL